MGKRILFSPVGGTDPIKYRHDGSMLHISRFYKPDIVYLYMSHEMMYNHKKDNRYVEALNLLGTKLNHHFDIRVIEREDLVNVQQYDVFYRDFREEIRKIEIGMECDDDIIINMASGTPAMKSALLVIATLAEYRFRAIQVSTPLERLNSEYEDRDNYDIILNWELNADNGTDVKNRCTEVECINLMKLLKIDMIRKHIGVYDYHAALTVAREIKDDLPIEAYELLQIADAREKLNSSLIDEINRDKRYDIYPVVEDKKKELFEYALVLQLKVMKAEYADFIRGITPIIFDLLEMILEKECKIILRDYCTVASKNVLNWDSLKLINTNVMRVLNEEFRGKFRFGTVYSIHLIKLICGITKKKMLRNRVLEVSNIEQNVRNIAAHEIIAVTDEWFIEKTGKSSGDILMIIKYLLEKAGIVTNTDMWNSYDKMNELINHYLY